VVLRGLAMEIIVNKGYINSSKLGQYQKFLSLIQINSLFFSSAEAIANVFDPWEGIFPQETIDMTHEYFKNHPDEKLVN
jgi:hypothetical protein